MSKKDFLKKVNNSLKKEKLISLKLANTVNQLDLNLSKLQEQINQLKTIKK